jgi:hypothetical protein
VRGILTDHFSVENDQSSLHDRRRSIMCTKGAYRRADRGSYQTHRADMRTRLCMAMPMCRQTKPISACTCAHMHKTDLLIPPNKLYTRSFTDVIFIDTDETLFLRETFSITAYRLKFLCTLHKKSKSCAQFRSIVFTRFIISVEGNSISYLTYFQCCRSEWQVSNLCVPTNMQKLSWMLCAVLVDEELRLGVGEGEVMSVVLACGR